MIKRYKTNCIQLACLVLLLCATALPAQKKTIRLAFFEGGRCLSHDILRDEFSHQLEVLTPDSIEFVPVPQGYMSADWKRDSCRILAEALVKLESVDMVVTMGPWVVEDLLAVGCSKPIIAMHRVDPYGEGLLDKSGRPVVENLTVHQRPNQIARDIDALTDLVRLSKLGVLFFPTDSGRERIISTLESLGGRYGFEIVSAEAYDNNGTYAFFKAFSQLARKVDAVYVLPMWNMDGIKIREFFKQTEREKMPTMTWEGAYLVQRGALASNSGYSVIPEARFAATKVIKIAQGANPADLPVLFDIPTGLSINEKTARTCGVDIPVTLRREIRLIKAAPPEDSRLLNVVEAIQTAIDANPTYSARAAAFDAASESVRIAKTDFMPKFTAHFSATLTDESGGPADDEYVTSIGLNQTLFSLETIRAIRAASRQSEISKHDLRKSQLDLELAVGLACADYRQAQESLVLYEEARNQVSRFLELAHTRQQTENGADLDVTRWDQERYKASIQVSRAENRIRAAGVILNALLNYPGHSEFVLDSAAFSEASVVRDYKKLFPRYASGKVQTRLADRLVDEALRSNPAVEMQRARVALQESLLSVNRARFYPSLELNASYNYRHDDSLSVFRTPEYFDGWYARAEIKLPLFLGGERSREQNRLKATLNRQEYLHDETVLATMKEVLQHYDALMATAADLPGYARAADLSLRQLESVISEYEAGRSSLVEVLEAKRNSLDTRLESIEARYRFYRTLARLNHALGWSAYEANQSPENRFFDGLSKIDLSE